jgi:hypothetical protein
MENPAAFEVIWGSTEILELAGLPVRVPSTVLGILILALHALRAPHLLASRRELEFLSEVTHRQSHASAVLEMATVTGSLAALRPFLEDLLPEGAEPAWQQPSREWHFRLMANEPGGARLVAILHAPWLAKPRMLWHAVFPSPEAFISGNAYVDRSLTGRLLQHRARWARFLRAAPQIMRDLRGFGG